MCVRRAVRAVLSALRAEEYLGHDGVDDADDGAGGEVVLPAVLEAGVVLSAGGRAGAAEEGALQQAVRGPLHEVVWLEVEAPRATEGPQAVRGVGAGGAELDDVARLRRGGRRRRRGGRGGVDVGVAGAPRLLIVVGVVGVVQPEPLQEGERGPIVVVVALLLLFRLRPALAGR